MLHATLASSDSAYAATKSFWAAAKAVQFEVMAEDTDLPPRTPAPSTEPVGHNDPLAKLTKKQIFIDCVWLSDESPTTKLVLLCISRFFNADAQSSSMSYSQVEAECSLSDRTVKRSVTEVESDQSAPATRKEVRKAAQEARDRWLVIERGKGFKTASGPQNLYHGIVPARWQAKLRDQRSRGISVEADEQIVKAANAVAASLKGVTQDHPLPLKGVTQDHPLGQGVTGTTSRGDTESPLLSITPNKKKNPPTPKGGDGLGFTLDGQPVTLSAAFDVFWAAFPAGRKRDHGGSADLFNAIATGKHPKRSATIQVMVDGARRYAASQPDPEYVPLPKTWLNGGRWADDVGQPDPGAAKAQQDHEDAIARLRAEQDAEAGNANGR